MFKKKKIWNKKLNFTKFIDVIKAYNESKRSKVFWLLAWWVWVFIIFLIWFWFVGQISNIKFDITSLIWLTWFGSEFEAFEAKNPILKTPDWKTNILIVWRWGDENDAPNLTDSIMVASINYDKRFVSLFSIPRDLYVEHPTGWGWRINETYARALGVKKDEKLAMKSLEEVITKITWEEIQYYVNMDFEWFRKIIDSIWWIEVSVPEAIVDTTYPGPNHTYQTFRIAPWLQTLDWSTALKYARSRHSTSDFDRSLRQQLIIKALKEKVLTMWFLSSPSKIKSLYTILRQYITTDLDISQIIALALVSKEIPKDNIVSSNLNDTCFYGSAACEKWWFLYVPNRADFGWAAILLQNWWTWRNPSNYDELVMYTNLVFNYPEIYKENLKINIFNATKVPGLANEVADNLKKYWFNIPSQKSVWNTSWDVYEKSVIFYSSWSWATTWSWAEKPKTVEALELFIFGWSKNIPVIPKYSKDPETKIEVIIWDDYKLLNF